MSLVLAGCSAPKASKGSKDAPPKPKDTRITGAQTGSGNATRYSTDEPRRVLWTIEWKESKIQYNEAGQFGGEMELVRGRIYRAGVETASFVARQAKAEFGTNRLTIVGGIKVVSKDPASELVCDTLVWDPELDRIEASGTVRIESAPYRMGPFDAVYCSPDLREIASPDMYRKTK